MCLSFPLCKRIMIIFYCWLTVQNKILRLKINQEVHQFDKLFLFTRQIFILPFRDLSFTFLNKWIIIKELRVVFLKFLDFLKFLNLEKLVDGHRKCTVYIQLECHSFKFYTELLSKDFLLSAYLTCLVYFNILLNFVMYVDDRFWCEF